MTNDKPVFIYLDQNKWIDLARAYNNRPDGKQFKSVLQKVGVSNCVGLLKVFTTESTHLPWQAVPGKIMEEKL